MSRDTDPQAKRTFRKTMTVLAVADVSSRNKRQTTEAYEDVAILPGYNISTTTNGASSKNHFDTDLHGNVNIFLAGAMLSGVIVVVALMCYCCHKNIRKSRPQEYSQYWRTEPDVHSLEVFSTEAHIACCDRQSTIDGTQDESAYGAAPSSCPVTPSSGPGPPPTYDSLIFDPRSLPASIDKKHNSPDEPGTIIPSVMSTLLGLAATPARPARPARPAACNEPVEQETAATVDEDLPSYEAALKLHANGYV